MKLTFNHWALIIEQLEKVANDEQENAAKRLEAIEALKILKEQKNRMNSLAGLLPPCYIK